MNIFQRLNEVRKKVPYLKKDKDVQGRYKVVTHDEVTGYVRDALIENGVMVVPKLVSAFFVNTGTTTAKGIPFMRYEASYQIDFVNCETPEDRVSVQIESHAIDDADKAPGKAISYATKYAMLKLFLIETGEDEEGRHEAKPVKQTQAQAAALNGSITPTTGAEEAIDPARKELLTRIAQDIASMDPENPDEVSMAHGMFYGLTETEEKVFVWDLLKPNSKLRSAIKKYHDSKGK